LNGGWHDPLVGGHVLIGAALGTRFTALFEIAQWIAGYQGKIDRSTFFELLISMARMAGKYFSLIEISIGLALILLFVFFLLRVLCRREWIAVAVFAVHNAAPYLVGQFPIQAPFALIGGGLVTFAVVRYGVLPIIVAIFLSYTLQTTPMTLDFSAWYAGSMLIAFAIALSIGVYGAYIALAGRPVLSGNLLER
jgi:hypothetical protein